jgi:hypothetical protein
MISELYNNSGWIFGFRYASCWPEVKKCHKYFEIENIEIENKHFFFNKINFNNKIMQ